MKTIKIGKRIEIRIYPKEKKPKYQKVAKYYPYYQKVIKYHPYHDGGYFYMTFDNVQAAKDCLTSMKEIIDDYGVVELADAYELVGLDGTFQDTKRGWTNLDGAIILPMLFSSMCNLRLPMDIPID